MDGLARVPINGTYSASKFAIEGIARRSGKRSSRSAYGLSWSSLDPSVPASRPGATSPDRSSTTTRPPPAGSAGSWPTLNPGQFPGDPGRKAQPRSTNGTRASAARAVLGRSASGRARRGRLHHRTQLVSDLGLALAVAGAPAGIADDDLEHGGERDPLEPGDLRRDGRGVADGGGEGGGLAVGQLQRQPVNGRADGRQVAELAAPDLRRDACGFRRRISRTKPRIAAAGVTPGGRERIRSHSRS